MLVSLWDEGGGSLWQALLYGHQGVASRPRKVSSRPAHVAIAPPLCPKVMVVEVKRKVVEKKGGKRRGGDGRPAKLWPALSPTFHHPPHLDPLVLKPLTKSKSSSLHSLTKFLLFIYFLKFLIL
jgi:hypothetical protein